MKQPRNAKIVMLSAVCVMALAGVLFLLFVVPTMQGGAPASMAQGEPPMPPEPGMDPGMAPPGGDPAMMPPGGDPGMMPPGGGMADPGMGMPGAGAAGAAQPASNERTSAPPLENSSANPFVGVSATGGVSALSGLANLKVTSYGTDWSKVPITARVNFPDAEVPERAAPPAPPSVIGPDKPLRVTSIMWTKDGQALAVYEYGEGAEAESGVVRPGDVVDTWRVSEIRSNYVIIVDRSSGKSADIYLTEKAPEPKKEPAKKTGSQRGTTGRTRPQRP